MSQKQNMVQFSVKTRLPRDWRPKEPKKIQESYTKNFICIQVVCCFWSSAFNQELQNGHISEDSLG